MRIFYISFLFLLIGCSKDDLLVANKTADKLAVEDNVKATSSVYGYRVGSFNNDEVRYWRDCSVMWDVISRKLIPNKNGNDAGPPFYPQIIVGDFNRDGWIDIFNPGTGSFNGNVVDNFNWLIWDSTKNTFDTKNLFNNKSFSYFGGNQRRSITVDLNKDGYSDVVIIDSGDDIISTLPRQPIRIVISDGVGGYELKEVYITNPLDYFHSGDIGDLNGDGLYDLVVACGNNVYISWGERTDKYFSTTNVTKYNAWDNNNEFKEAAGGVINVTIGDLNKDGLNDIILGANEDTRIKDLLGFETASRILINQGGGRFNRNGLINLPMAYPNRSAVNNDFRIIDFNADGLNDIISTGTIDYSYYYFNIYIQTERNKFSLDTTKFVHTINLNRSGSQGLYWKPWLILYDFNKDGQKDVSYIDPHNYTNSIFNKTVYIRKGNQFIEEDFYQYDSFCKKIMGK